MVSCADVATLFVNKENKHKEQKKKRKKKEERLLKTTSVPFPNSEPNGILKVFH